MKWTELPTQEIAGMALEAVKSRKYVSSYIRNLCKF